MIIKEVYIDLDSVLCNFNSRFESLFGEKSLMDYPVVSNNAKKKRFKQEFKDFVANRNFATLDPMPDFYLAVPFINKISRKIPTYILSSTATEEYYREISLQKKEWLKMYDIHITPIFVPGKILKQVYSAPGKILIDDTLSNIVQWRNRGGIGILHKNWKQTIKEFETIEKK